MSKITKCEKRVVYLQFALIATSRLKLGKVLKVIFCFVKRSYPFCISYVVEIEITSWLVSAYDFYSRVVKDR